MAEFEPTPEQLTTTRQQVKAEISDLARSYPGTHLQARRRYLNNFGLHFGERGNSVGNYRRIYQGIGDELISTFLEREFKNRLWDLSEKLLGNTGNGFIHDVLKAQVAEGVTDEAVDEIERRSKALDGERYRFQEDELLLPVFIRLRAMGYNANDLTA